MPVIVSKALLLYTGVPLKWFASLFTNFTNAISLLELHEQLAATLTIKNLNYVTFIYKNSRWRNFSTLRHGVSFSLQSDLKLSTFESKRFFSQRSQLCCGGSFESTDTSKFVLSLFTYKHDSLKRVAYKNLEDLLFSCKLHENFAPDIYT